VLHEPNVSEEKLPRLAIRPYPTQYVQSWKMDDGTPVTIRPIRPEDEPLLVKFHQTLSEDSVRLRYFHAMKLDARTTHERLTRVVFNDYDRELALVAERRDPATKQAEILAVARLSKNPGGGGGGNDAEFAILVSDRWQNRGVGTRLLSQLIQVARDEKITRLSAEILPENHEMQRLSRKLGFDVREDAPERVCRAQMQLT
jgi:acetyltransferase